MKVKELIAYLEDCEPEAEVVIASQPRYPVEHSLAEVSVRTTEDQKPTVLLLEGEWLAYGDREAWSERL
jgi:hypothetical protein